MKKIILLLFIASMAFAGVPSNLTNLEVLGATKSLYGRNTVGSPKQLIGVNSSDQIKIDNGAIGVVFGGIVTLNGAVNLGSTIAVDEINEATSAHGVIIDGVLAKDGGLVLSGDLSVSTSVLFVDADASRVGIGDGVPSNPLHVQGPGVASTLTTSIDEAVFRVEGANPPVSIYFGYDTNDSPYIQAGNHSTKADKILQLNKYGGAVTFGGTTSILAGAIIGIDSYTLTPTNVTPSAAEGICFFHDIDNVQRCFGGGSWHDIW